MPPRKSFLLRVDPALLDALQRWSTAEMRSLNGQIEYLLRDALRRSGRLPRPGSADDDAAVHASEPEQE
ncbi:MAG: hypothetical protein HYV19_06640 [Gemmatimonadetes bacterium]|nr:hypothetical protein [Gemmatimonadota bacterium]